MRHRPLCSVLGNICMFSRILRNTECFPGHFVWAFVIWISSEALKAVILMHWSSNPPSSPSPPQGLILKRYSLTDVRAASLICLAGKAAYSVSATTIPSEPESRDLCSLELTATFGVRFKSACWGNKYVCARSREIHFYVKERGPIEFVILFLSHFLPKNTLPWNKWVEIQCHCVSQHEIIRNAIITSPNRHFSEMRANNWEHKRRGRMRGVCVCVCMSGEGGSVTPVNVDPNASSQLQTSFC